LSVRRLFLIRHAKSSWVNPGLSDHDRPLNARGARQLDLMRDEIHAAGAFDGPVFCSTANRARLTLKGLLGGTRPACVAFEQALYAFDHRDLLAWMDDRHEDQLTLIGHNPALEDLADRLLQPGPGHLPTCAFVAMEISSSSWSNLSTARASLVRFLTPKIMRGAR